MRRNANHDLNKSLQRAMTRQCDFNSGVDRDKPEEISTFCEAEDPNVQPRGKDCVT